MASKTLTDAQIVALKAERDAAYNAMPSTDKNRKAKRQAMMTENGIHTLARSKGYGRASAAKALGITKAEYWVWEFVLPKGTTNHTQALKKVQALPVVAKATPGTKTKGAPKGDSPKGSKGTAHVAAKEAAAKDVL